MDVIVKWGGRAATVLVVACALFVTALVLRREFVGSEPPPARWQVAAVPEVITQRLLSADETAGSPPSPVRIVEFSDFACRFCAELRPLLDSLAAEYRPYVSLEFRNFPLQTRNEYAFTAAEAAQCAGLQGRFPEYRDLLFGNRQAFGDAPWEMLAREAGVDSPEQFTECLEGRRTKQVIEQDILVGHAVGVAATPTLFINDVAIEGVPPYSVLRSIVNTTLETHSQESTLP